MRFAIIYRPNDATITMGPARDSAEWFDTEEGAKQRAEKLLRDQVTKSVAIVQTLSMASTQIEWTSRLRLKAGE